MAINTQRLKRRWKWYAAYIVIFILSFALFYAYDRAQDQSTEQMLKEARRSVMSHDEERISVEQKVPAFDQANLNQEKHK